MDIPTRQQAARIAGTIIAWSLLGGFIGCTEAIHVAVNLPKANVAFYLVVGIGSGMLIAFLLAPRHSQAHRRSKLTGTVKRFALPVGWIVAGVICWVAAS